MTHINKYYNEIEKQTKLGAVNEQNLRPHFYDLLHHYTDNIGLTLQYEIRERANDADILPDGRMLREDFVVGHIENKDSKDNIYKEIDFKLNKKEYPRKNILFENTKRVILYQAGKKVDDIDINNEEDLNSILLKFVEYQTEEQLQFIEALDKLKEIIPNLADDLRKHFSAEEKINKAFSHKVIDFLDVCQKSINQNIVKNDVFEIIIQHILTVDVFIIFFNDADFHKENTIAKTVEELMNTLGSKKREVKAEIESYITVVKQYIYTMEKEDKKDVLKVFYENFYKALNGKKADVQGVVYTPLAIVRFMIEATDSLLYKYFNKTFASKNVKVLDPCSGTGIFMSELIEHIPVKDLAYKYENELFVNEIDILPYYIANLNIEHSYTEKMNEYKSFPNICLLDTLEFQKDGEGQLFGMASFSGENLERAIKQYGEDISVVIGNPPYNANQQSENDNNKNKVYSYVDNLIKGSYVFRSNAQKTKQFDMYKRFIRWASDRIKDNGMVSFITNNSYLDAKQDDGFRKCVQEEFDYIFIIDLKGNARKNDKKEGQSVFNIMVGTAIMFLIKDANVKEKKAEIYYYSMPDFAKRDEKLFKLTSMTGKFKQIEFDRIIPTEKGQWLGQTDNDFETHPALISKEQKNAKTDIGNLNAIFKTFSLGVLTARDSWAYDMNPKQLEGKVKKLIEVYNKERIKWHGGTLDSTEMNDNLDYSIKWVGDTKDYMCKNKEIKYTPEKIRRSLYRPFCKSFVYFEYPYAQRLYQNPKLFPTGAENENLCIIWHNYHGKDGYIYIGTMVSDFGINGGVSEISLYSYDEAGNKKSNVTDWGLKQFTERYGENVGDKEIFEYCYAVMSSPSYQEKYKDNLKVDYPRIPMYDDFEFYRLRGEALIKLHADYENATPYENIKITSDDSFLPEGIGNPNKNNVIHPMKLDKKNGVLILDDKNRIDDIPLLAFDYKIGSRSAIDWIIEYHKPKKLNPIKEAHHKTLIDENLDTYNWLSIRGYIFNLIPKIITVSIETMRIYDELVQHEK